MKGKLILISLILFTLVSLAFYVSAQAPAEKKQQQEKLLPKEDPLESRIYKLEKKVRDLERKVDMLEEKMRN
jgi:hypothetical protein